MEMVDAFFMVTSAEILQTKKGEAQKTSPL
jgi:hypothetical protein